MVDLLHKTLGPYQIMAVIGQGGMGTVYKALQPSLNRYVAIKVLPEYLAQDEEFVQRFRREANIVASLQHPNILTIYDIGQEGSLYYIVMQLLEGCTLAQLIEQESPLPLPRITRIIAQVTAALDYAHHHALIHRDIKPSNIFVGPDDHATLMDFGIVKALSETRLTRTGVAIGTPEYMSPEQIEGHTVDHRSDLYSLGIVLYQMLTGEVPFTADTATAILYAQVHKQPAPPSQLNPAITPEIEALVLKALEKEPQARYQSGAQLTAALTAASQQAESALVENLYAKATHLMAEWKPDEAAAVWEQVRLIKPDYKDVAAQLDRAQHQREVLREYHDLAEAVRQTQARTAEFSRHNPAFPDTEQVLKAPAPPAAVHPGVIAINIVLFLTALVLISKGAYQVRSARGLLPALTDKLSFLITLFSFGNFNLGLGIGLGIAALLLLLWAVLLPLLKRRSRH